MEYLQMLQKSNTRSFCSKVAPVRPLHPALLRFATFVLLFVSLSPLRSISSQSPEEFTWKTQKTGVFARFSGVYFVDRQRGWAVGSNGTLIVTEDGGTTWQKRVLPERQLKELLRDVWSFNDTDANERVCLLGEYGIVSPKGVYNITDRTFLLISSDREVSWNEGQLARQPYRRPDKALGRMSINESGKVQVKDPDIYQETLRTPEPILLRMFFVNDRVGWACGESGTIQVSRDAGATWSLQYPQTRKLLYDVMAVDEMKAWVVGAGGTVLLTTNGGQTWEERKSGVGEALRAVHFVDSERGWSVGANGRIITTSDGGARWQTQTSNTDKNLNDVFFVSAREGWAAGDGGTLLHTLDGGQIWEDDSQETHANFTRLFFVAPDCGWVVGTNGVIFKYMAK
jgi:photosystem II stability/assembly factor-like uncharacterized protein